MASRKWNFAAVGAAALALAFAGCKTTQSSAPESAGTTPAGTPSGSTSVGTSGGSGTSVPALVSVDLPQGLASYRLLDSTRAFATRKLRESEPVDPVFRRHALEVHNKLVAADTGRDGGAAGRAANLHINVPSDATPRVQEVHMTLLYVICDLVERELSAGD